MKLFDIRKGHGTSCHFHSRSEVVKHIFRWFEGLSNGKIKKIDYLENIKSNEVTLVFSKIVSKGLCCDKVWGFGFFHLAHVSVVFIESRS